MGLIGTPLQIIQLLADMFLMTLIHRANKQLQLLYMEKSGVGSNAIYKQWHFLHGSASGVATATSNIAQTVSLTDILAKELERGFDLTNDNVVGDRIVELIQQLPVPQRGAPSVVELASGSYAVDFDGNASVGQLKSVINLKTNSGQNWTPSAGSDVIGIYSSEELESSGQIKYYVSIFEQTGTGPSSSYKKWIFLNRALKLIFKPLQAHQ